MAALSQLLLTVFLAAALLPLAMAATTTTYPIGSFCWEPGMNYGDLNGSDAVVRRRSINFVVSDLVAKARTGGGFATSKAGRGYDAFYGLAQCRGDVSGGDCDACLAQAAKQMVSYCNYTSDSRLWYEYCFMRYDNYNFLGEVDTREDASVTMRQWPDMDNPKAFQKAAGKAMGKATAQAVAVGSSGLGRAKEQFTPFVSVYALAQCTRDLSPPSCAQCLSAAVSKFDKACGSGPGCQIDYSSCWARYEIYPFYFPLAAVGHATIDMTKYTKVTVH
ncbi:cysteine-rich repeat secretory protein 55-like [Oryza glaberrima]|uniref:Gnk2-homologous domain-containing protein n=1 Tax=Oryza glaberrima TaxID=4538 RepID=I1QFG5_ORYGL|nr:cysteine-rich repeat secretory protein 55-like [Oryza glaberrima]